MTDTPRHERLAVVRNRGARGLAASIQVGPHRLVADEPVVLGGGGAGPDPYEYLLAGLGACTVMTLRLYAERKGWALSEVEVHVRHLARASDGAPKDIFAREINLIGELSEPERARLLEIADRCQVSRTLAAGVTIQSVLIDTAPVGEATS